MSLSLRNFADELLPAGMLENGSVMRKPPAASTGSKEGDDEAAYSSFRPHVGYESETEVIF
jgi:hypothetical protein